MATIETSVPIISFTFDDAPRTAFTTAADILSGVGARATFYVSLGLCGLQTKVGAVGSLNDLRRASADGHELGCHTFDHLDPWETSAHRFVESVIRNSQALDTAFPGKRFRTFAYPINQPRPSVKSRLEKHFMCCRGGGQTLNVGRTDLNLVNAYFLDRRCGTDLGPVREMIDRNASCRGWLIFATHDVCDNPSRYGCAPEFFREVAEHAARSGALLLPVGEACETILAA